MNMPLKRAIIVILLARSYSQSLRVVLDLEAEDRSVIHAAWIKPMEPCHLVHGTPGEPRNSVREVGRGKAVAILTAMACEPTQWHRNPHRLKTLLTLPPNLACEEPHGPDPLQRGQRNRE